jgi:hypothetical protein
MPVKLFSPHRFRERILIYGGGGSGKTEAVLSIADAIGEGEMRVVDNDYSFAYERALATDHAEAADKVTVFECEPEWEGMIDALQRAVDGADPEKDWLVIDSISPTWEFVQSYMAEKITGSDLPSYLAELRKDSDDLASFNRALVDNLPWGIIKKEYAKHIYIPIREWKGHLILTAEAKVTSRQDMKDAEVADLYGGTIGVKPTGEGRLHHVTATTLLFIKKGHGDYVMTTVKDRNRAEMEREPISDSDDGGFAMDYLRDMAGWEPRMVRTGA